MYSVALIGADGSGKTTIGRRLEKSFPKDLRYLYMGVNPESLNHPLPTTRLVEAVKRAVEERKRNSPRAGPRKSLRERGWVWSMLRTLNRVAEEIYRLGLSWIYRKQGRTVIYDRYYKLDFACRPQELSSLAFSERLHRMWLSRLYPNPDLIIFLDAPPELLFERKREGTLDALAERQRTFVREGSKLKNFVRVDASRSLTEVYEEVANRVMNLPNSHRFTPPASGASLPGEKKLVRD